MYLCEKKPRRAGAERLLTSFLCALAAVLATGVISEAMADGVGKKRRSIVVPTGQTLFGKSYNQLASDWSNWLQSIPVDRNPALDPDGRYCDLNQDGRIWYLAGTFGGALGEPAIAERACRIPAGSGIFFPIFANISFAPEFTELFPDPECDGFTSPLEEVRCDVTNDTAIAPNVGMKLKIDGKEIRDLFAYRTQSQPGGFRWVIPEGGVFTVFGFEPGARFPTVVDGYWILLRPLKRGQHTVSFSADFDLDGNPDLGADYTLLVVYDDEHGSDGD